MTTSAVDEVRFLPGSDQTLMIYFGKRISLRAHQQVVRFLRLLERQSIPGLLNLHPAYSSVLVKFDALRWTHAELEVVLREYLPQLDGVAFPTVREIEIPVCYGEELGPDLNEVCALRGITPARAVELHAAASYLVYFLGFVPGFAYLGEVAEELATPRLASPRRKVPAGSVGIAGKQTGVYPLATPGGWRLIGRTPLNMFSAVDGTSLLAIGDRVRFVAISAEKFAELELSCR
jgi:KipI family sensor histidine kinase inhibitor